MQARRKNLEFVIEQAYQIVTEFHISDDAHAEKRVKKLAVVVRDTKYEVGWVTF